MTKEFSKVAKLISNGTIEKNHKIVKIISEEIAGKTSTEIPKGNNGNPVEVAL